MDERGEGEELEIFSQAMNRSKHCLNCGTELMGPFCHQCGQKGSTHRINIKHFFQHDLLHGVFHLDKGILYTLKCLLFEPGNTIRNFLSGKRVMHYNIFALFVIVVALKTLVDYQIDNEHVFHSYGQTATDEKVNSAIDHYYKFFYLLAIPLLSAFSYALSRRLRYNYAEHIVFNAFLLTGGFFYALLVSLFCYLTGIQNPEITGLILTIVYLIKGYYEVTRGVYTFIGFLWRIVSILLLFLLSLAIALLLVILIAYGGSFEGQISI